MAAFVAMGLVVALLVAACGGDDPAPAPKKPAQPAGPVATSTPIPSKAFWELDWDATLAAAQKEGKVVVTVYRADDREAVLEFGNQFPGIDVDAQVLGGRDFTARVPAERAAGRYDFDVYLSGATSGITLVELGEKSGKPIFGDTRSQLIRPDVVDDSNWIGGFDAQFVDNAEKHLFKMIANPGDNSIWVNTEKVDVSTLKTVKDLLRPEFKGKISSEDPSTPGAGATFFTEILVTNGEALVRQIFEETDIILSRDGRQLAEDIIRGDTWVSIGPAMNDFQAAGVGTHVKQLQLDLGGISADYADKINITCCGDHDGTITGFYSAGIGGPALVETAPHPNAAKIFLNWLLSPAGTKAWFDDHPKDCSPRTDFHDACSKDLKLEDGKGFVTFHDQNNVPHRRASQAIAKEYFGK
jgi:iron(III) transport system substrate-binding protein